VTWYYTREEGEEGQVLTDEGVPSGVRLTDLLENGPLPMGVVLEFVAYLADILTIAEEDQAMHGDISPGDVFIDEKGAVSLSNYGPMRTQGRAPEGRPLFPASDVYGLGVVLHAALSTQSLGAIPRQRDAHDDAIVDHLLAIDWSALERLPGRDSLIHFLCSMLAHDPGERPAPLDVANVLAGAGDKISGAGVTTWAKSRWGGSGAIESELPTVSEVLEAPESMGRVFNKTGQFSRRQTASAKGECTAFWSRDKISAMLDEGEDPLAGSQMFQRRALQQKLGGAEPDVFRTPPGNSSPDTPPPVEKAWAPDSTITGQPEHKDLAKAVARLRETASQPDTSADQPASPPSSTPAVRPSSQSSVSPPPVREPPKRPFPWLAVVIGAVGMGLVLGMLALAAAIYYSAQEDQSVATTDEATAASEAPPKEPEAKAKPKKAKKVKTGKPKAAPASASAPAPPKKRSKPAPPPPPTGEFLVSFRSLGAEAKFVCGDGQSGKFVGTTRRKFTDITTCRITIDDKRGVVQVRRASTVSCSVVGGSVSCTGA